LLRFIRNKLFLLALVTITTLVIMGVSASTNNGINSVSNVASVPLTPVQKFFSFTGQQINAAVSFFKDIKAIKRENEELKIKVQKLEKERDDLIEYREKIEELRKALNLKDRFQDYALTGANVIGKDPGNWFNVFRIDLGTRDGIHNDDAVVTASNGLVGRITSSNMTSSKVISLIDEDSIISGWISKPQGGPVIIRGDLSLKNEGLCRMDTIPVDMDVAVNDIVETSGLGGIFPKGIVIGKVREVKKTSSDLDRYAIIEPTVDFKRLEEVFVLKSKIDSGEV
jgi:rod shape-determining protein MreC